MTEISTGELARQVREVLIRFQGLADRLDNAYLTKETFSLYKDLVDRTLKQLEDASANLDRDKAEKTVTDSLSHRVDNRADKGAVESLERRVSNIEDNNKWLVRLVLGVVILAVIGLVVTTGGFAK